VSEMGPPKMHELPIEQQKEIIKAVNAMTEEPIPAERIIKIDPDGKYIIVLPVDLEHEEMMHAHDFFTEWWDDDSRQFCIVGQGAEVIKLEKP